MSSPFDSRIGTSTGDASSGPSTGKALRHIRRVDFHQGHNREKDERLGTNTGDALSGPSTDGKTLKHKGRILPGYGKEPTVDTEEVRREEENSMRREEDIKRRLEEKERRRFEEKSERDFKVAETVEQHKFNASFKKSKARATAALEELGNLTKELLSDLDTVRTENPTSKNEKAYRMLKNTCCSAIENLEKLESAERSRLKEKDDEISQILAGPFPYSNSSKELQRLQREKREIRIKANSFYLETVKNAMDVVVTFKPKKHQEG